MGEPLFVFIALAGSALLGFLFSTSLSRLRGRTMQTKNAIIEATLKENEMALVRLQSEFEAKVLAVENLKKIAQDIENQALEKESALKTTQAENTRLQEEIFFLTENPVEKVREIDVIREVPVLVLREFSMPETRKEKAKKLMKAFTKGYLDENGLLQTVANEPMVDEEL